MLARSQFDEAWDLIDIARAAELRVAETPAPDDCAEIVPGVSAAWYLAQAFPNDDLRALRWLARRRFGVFRPMQQRTDRRSGRAVQGFEPVFPGWIFVWCWPDRDNFDRVCSTPGVFDLFRRPGDNAPVAIGDDFVQRIRALGWVYDERAPVAARHAAVRAAREAKRKVRSFGRKERKELQRLTVAVRNSCLFSPAQWEKANQLDPGERIGLLKRALTSPAV